MKLVIGLGNIGEEYVKTRHNTGFVVLDWLGGKFKDEPKLESMVAKQGSTVYMKPTTYVNKSGDAVGKVARYYKIKPADVILIQDEMDLPFGVFKMSFDRGSAGHRGVDSIIKTLKTSKFWRIRIGIGKPKKGDIKDYVLSKLKKNELLALEKLAPEIEALIKKPLVTTVHYG